MFFFRRLAQRIKDIREPVEREALVAYFHRLPAEIQVKWFREGQQIVGKVTADGHEFMTQGGNADEFVEMVNDAVITVSNVPPRYVHDLKLMKAYTPKSEAFKKLRDINISGSVVGVTREKEPSPRLA